MAVSINGNGTVTGLTDLTSGDLTVDTNTLFVDSTNNRVGIGTLTPSVTCDVNGTINATLVQQGGTAVLVATDIGSTVQGYDADTAKYDDVTANFTGTLQVSGTAVVKAGDNISTLTNNSGYITGNQTITLSGDVSGSGTTAITVTVADDSHNHIISNVDGLQTALDSKAAYDTATSSTGYFDLPAGTTAQRPVSPATGMMRYNTTESEYEVYDGSEWVIVTTNYYPYDVEYLVVAGGGAGGASQGGGGGAGGYRAGTLTVSSGTGYTVTIGAGGAGNTSTNTKGGSGANSVFSTITSTGGGGGGGGNRAGTESGTGGLGASGGSGGAGAGNIPSVRAGGSGTAGQGNAGGSGYTDAGGGPELGGGGGGATATGGNYSTTGSGYGGNGGAGANWQSLGTYYAGGGGGGVRSDASGVGTGGTGGGGNGASGTGVGVAGTANRGGGGGGGGGLIGGGSYGGGGNGGSGIVIIRYAGSQKGTGGTVTSSGGYTYHTFTSSGTYTG